MDNHFNIAVSIEKLKEFWTNISDISTFKGVVLSGVIVGIILLLITCAFNKITAATQRASLRETLKKLWVKVSNVNTFRGAVLAAVVSGVILAFITPVFSRYIDATNQPGSGSVASYDLPSNDVSATPSDVPTSATIPNITTTNGTVPKGTAPKDIPISAEMEEILSSIQKISIGSSKDWVDEKLGSPFVSNTVKVTENGRVLPDTDENSIVGEFLECIYMFDIVSVKMYFDPSENSCKAFFVTLMEDVLGSDIVMPEAYSPFTSILRLWPPRSLHCSFSKRPSAAVCGWPSD